MTWNVNLDFFSCNEHGWHEMWIGLFLISWTWISLFFTSWNVNELFEVDVNLPFFTTWNVNYIYLFYINCVNVKSQNQVVKPERRYPWGGDSIIELVLSFWFAHILKTNSSHCLWTNICMVHSCESYNNALIK